MPADRQLLGDRHLRVLLVEDDDANRELESLMLQHLGYGVEAVADGAAAITALAAASYDAVVMDCHMPVMDGFAATAAIRAAETAGDRIPIIGLTSRDERGRCIEAGMDDQLAKPFALGELAVVLERATPPPAGAFAGVLDPAVVDQLRMLAHAGSTELLDKLETSFARDTPERLAALRTAIAEGDSDTIAFNLHTLKGSAANLGALAVVAACKAIEDSSHPPGSVQLVALLRTLEQAAADAQAALAALAASG